MNQYTILLANPSVHVYQALRNAAGLSHKSETAAQRGLANSLFSVQVLHNGSSVGMGRIIGDGGCFYQVVDIAVLPDYHRKGIGTMIMQEIDRFITEEVPETAYVSLIADGSAQKLYAKFGFQPTAPKSIGMALQRSSNPPPRIDLT